jgi:hypothetical protein
MIEMVGVDRTDCFAAIQPLAALQRCSVCPKLKAIFQRSAWRALLFMR